MSGLGALKKFGEMLMRKADKGDPRLRRALEQGYDLENPLVHGTNKPLADKKLREMYLTEIPEMALNYTGGGRRAGAGAPAKGPLLAPAVLKGRPYETDIDAFEKVSLDDMSWLNRLGIDDPEGFKAAVRARNVANWEKTHPGRSEFLDPWLGNSMFREPKDIASMNTLELDYYTKPDFFSLLDNPAFRDELVARGRPSIKFGHEYTDNLVLPSGKVKTTGERLPGTAVLAADPAVVRSPWAEFLAPGPGLMRKEGGLATMRGRK
jgi:hypothetical protein